MEWISVKEKRPKRGIEFTYLFFTDKSEVTCGHVYNFEGRSKMWVKNLKDSNCELASYWREFPEPPVIWDDE